MQLSDNTLEVLRNFATINPSIMVREDSKGLKTISPAKSVIASATIEEEFPQDFGIYDLPRFLQVLTLFNEPTLTFKDKFVRIGNSEDTQHTNYYYTPENMIITPPNTVKLPEVSVSFELPNVLMNSVLKAGAALQCPEILLQGKDGKISVQAVDSSVKAGDSYFLEVGETEDDFSVYIKIENLKLMDVDYTVNVIQMGKTFLTQFVAEEVNYIVASETNSKFKG